MFVNGNFHQRYHGKNCYKESTDMKILGENEKNHLHGKIERHMILAVTLDVNVFRGVEFWWVNLLR